ncbi:MAG: hypothetical protein WD597_04345 [Balneolaceae bacterium]
MQLADQRFKEMKEGEALDIYLKVLEMESQNYTALWNASLLFAREGYRKKDEEKKRELYKRAHYYGEKTILSYPDSGHAHYVFAVANGRLSDIAEKKERIRKSHIVKKHIEKAAELAPDYAPVWHLYGVWHSSIANISNAEKLGANLISEGLPGGASNEKAEEYLKRAIEVDPYQILFRLDLAKHYKNSGQREKAAEQFRKVLEMEPQFQNDHQHLEDAKALLKKVS